MSTSGVSGNSQAQQFISSLTGDPNDPNSQKAKYSQGEQDAKALKQVFSQDSDGAKKQKLFSDAMKEGDPMKKAVMLMAFEHSLNPDEKKALDKMKDDHKNFNDSLNDDQKHKEMDLGKQAMDSGSASLGGVFDLSS
jgi:hypothetical protein